jgi:hypothetical protein
LAIRQGSDLGDYPVLSLEMVELEQRAAAMGNPMRDADHIRR